MKKLLSVFVMALLVIGLTGCIDDPDGSKEKITGSTSSIQL